VWWLTLAVAACGAFAAAGNAQTPEVPTPKVERIEGERYRVGQIEVDKANMRLTVPATVIDLGSPQAPLEYFAVTKGGFKAYESLLELEANAFEFNLACILIGLEVKDTVVTSLRGRFDPQPTEGDPVAVFVHWESGGTEVRKSATELIRLQDGTSAPDEWVYTGSRLGPQGQFAAQIVGTVIGLMHDPASIIEHRSGVGLGKYGLAGYDPDVVPPAGSRVWLTVERLVD
jgi:hypothetical protein